MAQATDPRPHSDADSFLAADAAEQDAKFTALLDSVPTHQRADMLRAYMLGRAAAALPYFARGIEAAREMAGAL